MNDQIYVPESVEIANDLAIEEIHDCRTGTIVSAEHLLPRDSESLHQLRRKIERAVQQRSSLYLCAYCSNPIYLSLASLRKRSGLHFKHYHDDGDCIARTRTGKTKEQIEAQKYDGLKEGSLHIETKALLVESLERDPDFSCVRTEKRWTDKDGKKWRQPDVSALYQGKPVAFEIQLATTFLSVIEARSRFYYSEGARLIWVFRSFQTDNRPAAIDDIYFGNNRNAFVVSPETRDAAISAGRMMFECHWPQPELRGDEVVEFWKHQLIAFSDVKTDSGGREWFCDCDTERRRLRLCQFKCLIRDYCTNHDALSFEVRDAHWDKLALAATALKFEVGHANGAQRFRKLMSALFSLEEGKPVGFGFPALISVGHHIFDKHKPLMFYFLHAENAYGRREQFLGAGKPGVWSHRRDEARAQMKRGEACEPDKTHDALVRALFPEVAAEIERAKKKGRIGPGVLVGGR